MGALQSDVDVLLHSDKGVVGLVHVHKVFKQLVPVQHILESSDLVVKTVAQILF